MTKYIDVALKKTHLIENENCFYGEVSALTGSGVSMKLEFHISDGITPTGKKLDGKML